MAREEEINISLGQLTDALTQAISAGDPVRAAGLNTLMRLTQARDAGLVQEQQRLRRLLPANDPRLTSLELRLQVSQTLGERVAFEARRSDAGLDKVDARVWTLQGYLFIKDESWLRDKGVALFDANGTVLAGSEADLQGTRFLIRIAAPGDPANRTPPDVFVGIFGVNDTRRRALFLDTRPLKPQNGGITYVEINIGVPRSDAPRPPSPPSDRPQPSPTDPSRPTPRSGPQARAARGTTNRGSGPAQDGEPPA